MNATTSIIAYLDKLIAEGEALLSTKFTIVTSSFTQEDFVREAVSGRSAVAHLVLVR